MDPGALETARSAEPAPRRYSQTGIDWRGETGSDDDNLFPGFLGRLRVRKIFDEPSLLEGGEKRALKVEILARRRPAYAGSVVFVLLSGSFCSATLPKFLLYELRITGKAQRALLWKN